MAFYEKCPDGNLVLYKKFEIIDGREALVNFVALLKTDDCYYEFQLQPIKCLGQNPKMTEEAVNK